MRATLVFALSIALIGTLIGTARAEETRRVDAPVISYLPQGSTTVVILRRGARDGVTVGLVWRCRSGRYLCKTTEVYEFRSKCIAPIDFVETGEPHSCSASVPATLQTAPRSL